MLFNPQLRQSVSHPVTSAWHHCLACFPSVCYHAESETRTWPWLLITSGSLIGWVDELIFRWRKQTHLTGKEQEEEEYIFAVVLLAELSRGRGTSIIHDHTHIQHTWRRPGTTAKPLNGGSAINHMTIRLTNQLRTVFSQQILHRGECASLLLSQWGPFIGTDYLGCSKRLFR